MLFRSLALQLQRRAHGIGERLQQSHDDTVAIMESGLAVSLRAARDWGHWDDAYRYMRGENPGYPVNNLGTAALFDGGAVMVLLERDGQARLAFTSPAFRNVSYGGLIRCLQANRQRLTRVSSTMRLACRIDDGSLYLGAATSVSNNDGSAPAAGTIGMFDPLLKPDYAPRILERMRTLRQELVLVAAGDRSARVITPPIHGDTDRLLALRRPPIAALLGRSLLEDLPVLLAIGAVATALRALQMLDRRARARAERLMERRANQRIRQACQALDQLVQPLDAGSALATTTPPPETSSAEGGSRTGTAALQPATQRRLEHTTARLQAMVRHTRSLALHDALTGLPNRRHFLADLEERFRQAQGTEPALAILFIDVDRFKSINDLYGHAAGDTVLSLVSRRLRHLLGPCDLLARFGGDEQIGRAHV